MQAPAHPPLGCIALTIEGNFFTTSTVPPIIFANGYRVQVPRRGPVSIPVQPGPIDLNIHMWHPLTRYGGAGLRFEVAPGQTVPVSYAQPTHVFGSGRIGVETQKQPGLAWSYIGVGAAALLLLVVIGFLLLLFIAPLIQAVGA